MVLVCHVISQDHVVKGSCDFMGRSPSNEVPFLPSFVVIGTNKHYIIHRDNAFNS